MSTHTVTKLGPTPNKCKCHSREHHADHGPGAFLAVGVPTTSEEITDLEVELQMELLIDNSFPYEALGKIYDQYTK